jgi:hypothetical protein
LLEELAKIQKEIFNRLALPFPYKEERGRLPDKKLFSTDSNSGINRRRGRPKGGKNKKGAGGQRNTSKWFRDKTFETTRQPKRRQEPS